MVELRWYFTYRITNKPQLFYWIPVPLLIEYILLSYLIFCSKESVFSGATKRHYRRWNHLCLSSVSTVNQRRYASYMTISPGQGRIQGGFRDFGHSVPGLAGVLGQKKICVFPISRPTHHFLADRLRFFYCATQSYCIGDHIEKKWSKSDHFERSYEVLKTILDIWREISLQDNKTIFHPFFDYRLRFFIMCDSKVFYWGSYIKKMI